MIPVMAILSGGPIMDAAGTNPVGYAQSSYGEMRGQPNSLVTQGTEFERLSLDNGNRITVYFSGDQTTFLTGKTLVIGANNYAFSTFATITYSSGQDRTECQLNSVTGTPIEAGKAYDVDVTT